jgi:hypothetical protein
MAVTCGWTQLSYRIFDHCTHGLVLHLLGGGINPGDNVVPCIPRSSFPSSTKHAEVGVHQRTLY